MMRGPSRRRSCSRSPSSTSPVSIRSVHHVAMDAIRHRVPGPFTERLGEVARRARRWIRRGFVYEAAGRKTYNTALLFAPDGSLAGTYRKLFPWMPLETSDPGEAPPPVIAMPDVGAVGVMICYDGWFPEVARSLAMRGAEVILHPTLTSTPDREEELVHGSRQRDREPVLRDQRQRQRRDRRRPVDRRRPRGAGAVRGRQRRGVLPGGAGPRPRPDGRERGTRGLNRVLEHVRAAPRAAFSAYDDLGT